MLWKRDSQIIWKFDVRFLYDRGEVHPSNYITKFLEFATSNRFDCLVHPSSSFG